MTLQDTCVWRRSAVATIAMSGCWSYCSLPAALAPVTRRCRWCMPATQCATWFPIGSNTGNYRKDRLCQACPLASAATYPGGEAR